MLVSVPKSRPIYKISAKEARWEAFLPKNVCLIFKIEGNLACLQARLSHFVGHLPLTTERVIEVDLLLGLFRKNSALQFRSPGKRQTEKSNEQ
jgi:hypothetical protein